MPTNTPGDAQSLEVIARIREFNRFYTRMIGALGASFVGTPYTLTEARLLFEIARRTEIEVTELRRLLNLDAGYSSRILRRFIDNGLIARTTSPGDARRHIVRLTEAGAAAFAEVDTAQAAAIERLIVPLDLDRRNQLVKAMGAINAALEPTQAPRAFILRPPASGDIGWVVARHGALYAAAYRWGISFEALVARIMADYVDNHDPQREAGWIAEVDGEPVGCVFCVAEDDTTARLRLLLVEPSARGLGLGTKLVDECLRFAERAGYRRITLWTNSVLASARRIYEAAGFHLDRESPHHSWGHDLVGQDWSRSL
ncbi:MAG TPA: helix-turn-helix domain-containing GNAT family N-acetyltransferase [Mycobacteriales bacterium]|jgi:DNA-binding MarR family transcriptional regulator/GNAT superfamily N-acetyltransferase|nr:helix-turn-helix domain-containing GNAT family N-acetyltransferase [Mycobacteriales bacterium]